MTNEEIKLKYPNCGFCIEAEGGLKLYLNKPSRYTLSPVMAKIGHDPIIALEEMAYSLAITEISDMKILEEDDLFLSILGQLSAIVEVKKSTITKL
jgi:hypothetical protein